MIDPIINLSVAVILQALIAFFIARRQEKINEIHSDQIARLAEELDRKEPK